MPLHFKSETGKEGSNGPPAEKGLLVGKIPLLERLAFYAGWLALLLSLVGFYFAFCLFSGLHPAKPVLVSGDSDMVGRLERSAADLEKIKGNITQYKK